MDLIPMVVARMSIWKFKGGQREAAFNTLERTAAEESRRTRGYRGSLQLLSVEDPDAGIIITLWEDEDALNASAHGLFKGAVQELKQYVAAPPRVEKYKLDGAEMFI